MPFDTLLKRMLFPRPALHKRFSNSLSVPHRILFCFGFWWAVPSLIAVCLPLFQRGRLQSDPSYRGVPPLVLCLRSCFYGMRCCMCNATC